MGANSSTVTNKLMYYTKVIKQYKKITSLHILLHVENITNNKMLSEHGRFMLCFSYGSNGKWGYEEVHSHIKY